MAVENKFVNADIAAGKKPNPALVNGQKTYRSVTVIPIAAADDDGSVYRFMSDLDPNAIITNISVLNDAITGGTSYSIGLYQHLKVAGGSAPAVAANVFMNAQSLATANAVKATPTDGMSNVTPANLVKKVFEHAGHTAATKLGGYDLALTANTVGTVTGNVTVIVDYIQG